MWGYTSIYYIVYDEKWTNLYFKNNPPHKKVTKLNYLSSNLLRGIYLLKLNPIHYSSEKKIFSRGSSIPLSYCGCEVKIHKGRGFRTRKVNRWMLGFVFGEFTWNRKAALYKAKQKKKKK